jgi:hypothetical protein
VGHNLTLRRPPDSAARPLDADAGRTSAVEALRAASWASTYAAAAEAICCLRIGQRSRDAGHRAAVGLLATVHREGPALAKALCIALEAKDPMLYSTDYLTRTPRLRLVGHTVTRRGRRRNVIGVARLSSGLGVVGDGDGH